MSNPAKNVIARCGASDPESTGHEVVADWCGVSVTTTYRWTYPKENGGTGGKIPMDYVPVIIRKAKKVGIELAYADFFPTEEDEAMAS